MKKLLFDISNHKDCWVVTTIWKEEGTGLFVEDKSMFDTFEEVYHYVKDKEKE